MDHPRSRGRARGRRGDSRGWLRSRGRGRGGGHPHVQVFAPESPPHLNLQSSNRDLDSLILRFASLSTSEPGRVIRPGFGDNGKAIALRANFFQIKYPKDTVLYDHMVYVSPEIGSANRRMRKRLFELFEDSQEVSPFVGSIAHDSAQRLVSKLSFPDNFSISISFYEEGETGPHRNSKIYKIFLLKAAKLHSADLDRYLRGDDPSYNPMPIISAFNLITKFHAARTGAVFRKKRYFFNPRTLNDSPARLDGILEAWEGFFASVRPVYKNLMVNVNVCLSVFYVPYARLSDALLELQASSRGAGYPRQLYGCVIITTQYLGYRKRSPIRAIGPNSARKTVFQCDELGGQVSVERYFQHEYNISLEHPDDVPVINVGSSARAEYIPAELCEIEPGQSYRGSLTDWKSLNMVRAACRPPYINAQAISGQGFGGLGLRQQAFPMQGFGLGVSPELAVVPARVYDPPRVLYQPDQRKVVNGSWNMSGVKFSRPASLTRAAILVLNGGGRDDFRDQSDPALGGVVTGILAKCRNSGMQVEEGLPPLRLIRLPRPNLRDRLRGEAIDEIEKAIKSLPRAPNIILVFMTGRDAHVYSGLKRLCDIKFGIQTVCMLMPKVRKERGQDQYFSNIALKVNTKLGGINHKIPQDSLRWLKNTMLVGVDVAHPGPGSPKGMPSIAAVVASCDEDFMHYPASMRLQEHRKEMITHAKDMITERIIEYHKHMKTYPERIIVFRDGVSEGQLDQVLLRELPRIKEAFGSIFNGYKPKLTIVTSSGKRHQTRFYPTNVKDVDKTSNTKPGTVVDQGVTGIYNFDFYLQAHAITQGTVRMARYSVIYDENKFRANELQQGMYDLSHLWARATRSVKWVPPAYWAACACKHGRMYLHGILNSQDDSLEGWMAEEQIRRRAEVAWGTGVHDNLKSTMFYM